MIDNYGGWRKSVRSNSSGVDCVEVASAGDGSGAVAVRDSRNTAGPVLEFSRAEWGRFLGRVKAGA